MADFKQGIDVLTSVLKYAQDEEVRVSAGMEFIEKLGKTDNSIEIIQHASELFRAEREGKIKLPPLIAQELRFLVHKYEMKYITEVAGDIVTSWRVYHMPDDPIFSITAQIEAGKSCIEKAVKEGSPKQLVNLYKKPLLLEIKTLILRAIPQAKENEVNQAIARNNFEALFRIKNDDKHYSLYLRTVAEHNIEGCAKRCVDKSKWADIDKLKGMLSDPRFESLREHIKRRIYVIAEEFVDYCAERGNDYGLRTARSELPPELREGVNEKLQTAMEENAIALLKNKQNKFVSDLLNNEEIQLDMRKKIAEKVANWIAEGGDWLQLDLVLSAIKSQEIGEILENKREETELKCIERLLQSEKKGVTSIEKLLYDGSTPKVKETARGALATVSEKSLDAATLAELKSKHASAIERNGVFGAAHMKGQQRRARRVVTC